MIRGSKKIIMSVLTLTLTFIALGTITFAWFSLSTVSNISNITGEVRGAEGLEVRLITTGDTNPIPWKSNLTGTDVSDFIKDYVLDANFEFDAVTTEDGKTFKKMNPVSSIVNADDADVNVDYIEFKIQFKSPTEGDVQLTEYELKKSLLQTVTIFEPINQYVQFNSPNDNPGAEKIAIDPSNGARFSLEVTKGTTKNEDINNDPVTLIAYQKPAEDYEGASNIWTGNTANNTPVEHGQYSFLTDSKGMILHYNDGTNTYPIALTDIADHHKLADIEMFEAETDVTSSTKFELVINDDSGSEVIPGAGLDWFVGELTIRIWLDGWDADTYDVLYEGILELILQFSKV